MKSFLRPPEPPDPPDSLCRDNDAPHHRSLCAHPQPSSTSISLPPPLSSASDPAPAAARTSLPPRSYSSFSTATDLLAVSPTVISDPIASPPLSSSFPPWIHLSDQPPLPLRCFPSPMYHCLSYGQPPLPLDTPLDGILDEIPYLGQYVLKNYRSLGLPYLSWRLLLRQYEAGLRLSLSRLLPHDEAYIWKLLLCYVQALGLALSRLLPLCKDLNGNFKPSYMVESKLISIINGLKYYKIPILHVSIGGLGFGLCMYSFMERFVLSKLFLVEWKELKSGKIHYQVSFGLLVGHLTPGVNDMSLPVNRLVFSAFDAVFGTLQDALDFDIGWCFKDATRKPVALVQFAEAHTLKVALIATTILGVRALLRFSNSKSLVMPLVSNGVCNELKPLLHDLRCLSTVFTSIIYAFIFCLAIVLANALVLYGLVLNTSSIFGV